MRLIGLPLVVLIALAACRDAEVAEVPPSEVTALPQEVAEEGAPIVARGEEATFQTPSGSFALSLADVSCETGELVVSDVAGTPPFPDQTFTPEQGQFCMVEVALRNAGQEPAFFQRFPRLMTADGTLYGHEEEASATVTTYRHGQVSELNPGTEAREVFVFDIPADEEPDLLLVESVLEATEPVVLSLR